MSAFNQQGQTVHGNQTNIAGDVINMSGSFSGAILNIKSTLSNHTFQEAGSFLEGIPQNKERLR